MAFIVDSSLDGNTMSPIGGKGLILGSGDVINREMRLPSNWNQLRLGMLVSLVDNDGDGLIPSGTVIESGNLIKNGFFFGVRDSAEGTPFSSNGGWFIGESSMFSPPEEWETPHGKCYFLPPTGLSNEGWGERRGRVSTAEWSENTPVSMFGVSEKTSTQSSIGFDSSEGWGAMSFISDATGTKPGVCLCGINIRKLSPSTFNVNAIFWEPPPSSPLKTTGIVDFSEESMKQVMYDTQIKGNNEVVRLNAGKTVDLSRMKYFYFRHPFSNFSVRIHNYGWMTI